MTLVELLVALALLTLLGGTLTYMMHQSVRGWRKAESRRKAFEEAQLVLRSLRADFRAVFAAAQPHEDSLNSVRFVCDIDAQGRQRLGLVRTCGFGDSDPLGSLGGSQMGADAYLDGNADREEAFTGRLLPGGGLQEVLYAFDPTACTMLRRGARSPVGGEGSLFAIDVVDNPQRLRQQSLVLSTRVLYLGLALWSGSTRKWDDACWVWDSTRGLVAGATEEAVNYPFWQGTDSLYTGADDVFPERARITLVVMEDAEGSTTSLTRPLQANDAVIHVVNAAPLRERLPWVRVGAEWIRCRYLSSTTLAVVSKGRGGRGTQPQLHPGGTEVTTGRTFSMDCDIPAVVERWR